MRGEYDRKQAEVNGLEDDIEDCKQKSARAVKLLNSLKSEKQKWSVLNRIIIDKFVTLEGDCLLTSAIVVYLG